MILRGLAFFISRIFDFYFWLPVVFFVALFGSGLTQNQITRLLVPLLLLDVTVPIFFFFLMLLKRKISDIDVTERRERYKLIAGVILMFAISTILASIFGNRLFFILHLTVFLMGVTILVITFFFKISGHMLMNTGSIFVINFLFDWKLLWIFSIVPLVALARMYLKKHTLAEVSAGAIVGLAEPYLILKFFKLL